MASPSDPRELTPQERRAFGNWYAQQLESDLGLTVPERGLRSNRMRMERAFAAGLAARASSPAPDRQARVELIAPIIERMESRYPERIIAGAVLDALAAPVSVGDEGKGGQDGR